jgi:hypothetical protein
MFGPPYGMANEGEGDWIPRPMMLRTMLGQDLENLLGSQIIYI